MNDINKIMNDPNKYKLPSTATDIKLGNDSMTNGILYTYGVIDKRRGFISIGDVSKGSLPYIKGILRLDNEITVTIDYKKKRKMKKLNREKVIKFFEYLEMKDRGTPKDRDNYRYGNKCEKEVFCKRVNKLLKYKPIRFIFQEESFTTYDKDEWGYGAGKTHYIKKWCYCLPMSFHYYLGYGEEIELWYFDVLNGKIKQKKMGFNDVLNFEFEYVSTEKIEEVRNLLIVTDTEKGE